MADDPRPDFDPDWPVCIEAGCRGAQVVGRQCVAHATDLSGLKPSGDLDLRGVVIGPAKLAEVLGRFRNHEKRRFVIGRMRCDYAWFTGRSWFDHTDVGGVASFNRAHFSQLARFDGLVVDGELSFVDARFEDTALMEPLSTSRLDLRGAWFANQVRIIDTEAWLVFCTDARFEGGMTLLAYGEVYAKGAHFGAPSTILAAKMRTLSSSDVSNLVLEETDLSRCEFLGALRLEQLRIEGSTRFAKPTGLWRARRRMLAEEGDEDPARVAALYRALRKSLEDSKYEAGAGDFYYGEMECRRRSDESSRAERMILWLYWLLSGYGQRASRALIGLVLVIATVTGLLTVWGQDFGMAARIALGAVVFRDDRTDLTAAGEWVVLVARFLGPVLLALAVLAIRARVKR